MAVVLDAAIRAIAASSAIDVWQEWQPRSDAELLLDAVAPGLDHDASLTAAVQHRFDAMVQRRVNGEPVALIVGRIEFAGLTLLTRPGVFVPRLSSELLAASAVLRLHRRRQPVVVDVATGAAPVACAVAAAVPGSRVWALDISKDAVLLARANARRLGLASRLQVRRSDGLAALPASLRGQVAVVTLHPPYVAASEIPDLPQEIIDYEPVHTLTDQSEDGLGLARDVSTQARTWLRPGGWMLLEVGPHLLRRTKALLAAAGYREIEWQRDDTGATRVVAGRR